MPVVINEFEVVADGTPPQRSNDDGGGQGDAKHDAMEPVDVTPVLRALETQALRAWAH